MDKGFKETFSQKYTTNQQVHDITLNIMNY